MDDRSLDWLSALRWRRHWQVRGSSALQRMCCFDGGGRSWFYVTFKIDYQMPVLCGFLASCTFSFVTSLWFFCNRKRSHFEVRGIGLLLVWLLPNDAAAVAEEIRYGNHNATTKWNSQCELTVGWSKTSVSPPIGGFVSIRQTAAAFFGGGGGCWVLNGIACSNSLARWSLKRTRDGGTMPR